MYSDSVLNKLYNSQVRLDSILTRKEWVPSAPFSTSAGSGASLLTTQTVSPTFDISGNLDDFFGNLASAFDILAQVINSIYLVPPLDERDVNFGSLALVVGIRCQNETIARNLSSLIVAPWFVDLKGFRHCQEHRNKIQFQVVFDPISSGQTISWPQIKTILLPDDPDAAQPNFAKGREVRVFCADILQNALNEINSIFGVMDARVRAADHVPV